jgi:hypothetical protein
MYAHVRIWIPTVFGLYNSNNFNQLNTTLEDDNVNTLKVKIWYSDEPAIWVEIKNNLLE